MSDDALPGRVMTEKLGGVCGLLPKSFTLFKTKLYDFPNPTVFVTRSKI